MILIILSYFRGIQELEKLLPGHRPIIQNKNHLHASYESPPDLPFQVTDFWIDVYRFVLEGSDRLMMQILRMSKWFQQNVFLLFVRNYVTNSNNPHKAVSNSNNSQKALAYAQRRKDLGSLDSNF